MLLARGTDIDVTDVVWGPGDILGESSKVLQEGWVVLGEANGGVGSLGEWDVDDILGSGCQEHGGDG